MKPLITLIFFLSFSFSFAQNNKPTDFLSSEFHQGRRDALRKKMPKNSVATFFSNPIRNRANDVDYVYHQDPDFYYLTGYREPHAVLVIFSEKQIDKQGNKYDEILFVQEKNPRQEMWTGIRLGVEGAKNELGFKTVFNGKDFLDNDINWSEFQTILHKPFTEDYRDNQYKKDDLASLIKSFQQQIMTAKSTRISTGEQNIELDQEQKKENTFSIDSKSLRSFLGELREIKSEEELTLLKKAVRISAMGQIEVMKAMHPNMSETEIQGLHEYIYKKYGSEYEGYPSIVGAGSNGCVLHYVDNNKTKIDEDLVLMDLGAEYRGYTADVTRTIPATGKFSKEQAAIYDLVYKAQEAGIANAIVGNSTKDTHFAAKKIIDQGLYDLGIIENASTKHRYFPHGTSHHIGLDVHDLNTGGLLKPNMVITVEPGIYIPPGSDCDKKWWGIAVRIEDDILITENGPVNLSAEAPRERKEIEQMMAKPSVFDKLELPKLD